MTPVRRIKPPSRAPLKPTTAFQAVFRRGRWARGRLLSIGVLTNQARTTRIGMRVRRGMKRAVTRNRIRRQVRAALFDPTLSLRDGLDVLVVIHRDSAPARSAHLQQEVTTLCSQLGVLSRPH